MLLRQVLQHLAPRPGETVVDCTVGFGGHAMQMARRISPKGVLIGMDVDEVELFAARERLAKAGARVSLHHCNYAEIGELLAREGVCECDVILADLGVSSMQVDDPSRGMSYKHADAPLDMRMNTRLERTAADLLATISREDLAKALWELADEDDHERLAEWIVLQRNVLPITRTGQLTRLVLDAKRLSEKTWRNDPSTRYGELHPAARTFQALRILVNDELGNLRRLLAAAPACLAPGGRFGVISFHSGEDRLVKHAFRDGLADGTYESISPKVIVSPAVEVRANPRSASAKFRWARRSEKA